MAKARTKAVSLDDHARTIAKAIAKGRMPQPTAEVDRFLEPRPADLIGAADGVCRHMPPAGDDEPLGVAYLLLLRMLLEQVRTRAERGYDGAAEQIAAFQATLVTRVEAGKIDGTMLAYLGGALQQAKIPASSQLTAIAADFGDDDFDEQNLDDEDFEDEDDVMPADIALMLDQILDACDGDPFLLVNTFVEGGHTLPDEAKSALVIHLATDGRAEARAAAVLCLLDSSAAVRRAAAGALVQSAATLSSVDLRRLIAMRNWRPESERAEIDIIIHKMRASGVACAAWEKCVGGSLQASPIDGTGAQVFQLISPVGRKKRISSILVRDGITDAFSTEPQTSRELTRAIDASIADVQMLDVERSYLDRMVSHHLARTVGRGEVPPCGLLEVAEIIGGADWQPQQIDFRAVLDALIAELPAGELDSENVEIVLADSDALIDLEGIEDAWFEDDAELREVVQGVSRRARDQFVTGLLLGDGFIAARRKQWAEFFVQTALWMREAPDDEEMGWSDLVVVARAVLEGHDLTRIGLMRNVAERTVAALSEQLDEIW